MKDCGIQVNLNVENIPESLARSTPKVEMERIPRFVYAEAKCRGSLCLVNFGPETPSVDDRAFPWIKTTEEGYLDGIWIWHTWKNEWVQQKPVEDKPPA